MREEKAGGVHMKKPYALALFGLLLCSSLSLFAVSIQQLSDALLSQQIVPLEDLARRNPAGAPRSVPPTEESLARSA
jgi:hypothetical protein